MLLFSLVCFEVCIVARLPENGGEVRTSHHHQTLLLGMSSPRAAPPTCWPSSCRPATVSTLDQSWSASRWRRSSGISTAALALSIIHDAVNLKFGLFSVKIFTYSFNQCFGSISALDVDPSSDLDLTKLHKSPDLLVFARPVVWTHTIVVRIKKNYTS